MKFESDAENMENIDNGKDSPGFEFLLVACAIALFLFLKRKR
jgi:hypothetical protein